MDIGSPDNYHQTPSFCSLCKQAFTQEDIDTLRYHRHHSHLNFFFIGFAHTKCNISARLSMKIPVIFHNLKSYGSIIIVQALNADLVDKVDVIAKSAEKFKCIQLYK